MNETEPKSAGPVQFLSESWEELKRVTHPTRQETIQAAIVTMVLMGAFALVLALLDWILRAIVWQLL